MSNPATQPTDRGDRIGWGVWLAFVALTIAAVAWRFWVLWARPIWADEAFTWVGAQHNLRTMLAWDQHPTHPPLSYLLVKVTTRALSTEAEWALRLPSLLSWCVAIVAAYFVGQRLHSRAVGLGLSLYLALDPVMAMEGLQARMHMMSLAFTLLSVLWVDRLLRRREARSLPWLLLGILLSGVFWSSSAGLYLVPAILMCVAVVLWRGGASPASEEKPATDRRGAWQGYGVAVAFWFAACHVGLLKLISQDRSAGEGLAAASSWMDALSDLTRYPEKITNLPWVGYAIVLAGVVALVVLSMRRVRMAQLLLVIVITNLLGCILLSRVHQFVTSRYFMPTSVAVWAGVLAMSVELWRRQRAAVALLPVCMGLVLWSALRWQDRRDQVGAYVSIVKDMRQPGEAIAFCPDWLTPIGRYYLGDPAVASPASEVVSGLGENTPSGVWLVSGYIKDPSEHLNAISVHTRGQYQETRSAFEAMYRVTEVMDWLKDPQGGVIHYHEPVHGGGLSPAGE